MTRRLMSTLGALAAGLLLAVAVPGSAQAATGDVIINDIEFTRSPHGCVVFPSERLLDVDNSSDRTVTVYRGPDCAGDVAGEVPVDHRRTYEGKSVFIP
ncbi:hypothetical protein AB0D16_18680 [Streptomyces sp. NPDC048161]|uniref:hypothetical protein n=1 Tax=Streptomyces sp. NPDC048161 TaxID=3160985 RepID=UPI0033DFCEBF